MSAAILRINTINAINTINTAISRTARASPNSPNSRGSSDNDEMPALIFALDSDSDSYFETTPSLVDDGDDDGEVVRDAIQHRTAPQELTGYAFADFFAGALNIDDVHVDAADTTFIVYDGKTRGFKSLGEIYMIDAYHQKIDARHHRRTNAIIANA